jgi:hypothetical protein
VQATRELALEARPSPTRLRNFPKDCCPSATPRGEEPESFARMLRFGVALTELAAEDPAVHKLNAEVSYLRKPHSAYLDPELVQHVMTLMVE